MTAGASCLRVSREARKTNKGHRQDATIRRQTEALHVRTDLRNSRYTRGNSEGSPRPARPRGSTLNSDETACSGNTEEELATRGKRKQTRSKVSQQLRGSTKEVPQILQPNYREAKASGQRRCSRPVKWGTANPLKKQGHTRSILPLCKLCTAQ